MAQTAEGNALTAEQRAKMCKNKKRFDREGKAIDFAIQAQRRGAMRHGRVYRCPVCTGYHVTSQASLPTEPRAA